jgi:hypothetical protein
MFVPSYHGTNRRQVYERVAKGDVIWLVGMLVGGAARLPPAIDARILVAKKQVTSGPKDRWRYWLDADPTGSRFFLWGDASALVAKAFTGTTTGAPWRDRPQALRVARWLDADLSTQLDEHSAALEARPTVFLSYAWREATPLAAVLTRELGARGVGVWWDRWSMPRSVVELQAMMPELAAQLAKAVAAAKAGVCLVTPRWRTSGYSQGERAAMKSEGLPVFGENVAFSCTYGLGKELTLKDAARIKDLATVVADRVGVPRR